MSDILYFPFLQGALHNIENTPKFNRTLFSLGLEMVFNIHTKTEIVFSLKNAHSND
ncbi:hypothetical protein [Rodentibacter heidelbergensis]|uniref:hypothetical protein n=1 Tax=Rodentibacter heidelbergensis TaxID=1908258 RepID=UPI001ABF1843|nr:hypothetical protein [Rodentibacter heidelbergensis]